MQPLTIHYSISCAKENGTSDLSKFIELSELKRSKRGAGNKKRVWHCHPNYGMRAIGWILDCGFWAMEGGYSFIRSLVPYCQVFCHEKQEDFGFVHLQVYTSVIPARF